MPEKRLAPRQCKSAKCSKQTRHQSGRCAECRYDAEMDATEVRYEVAVAKGIHPSLESLTAPVDTQRASVDGQ